MNQAYESASFVRCVVPETADIQAASAAVAANPESGDAWMKKGHALAKVSMMREAEECYAMAISCDPFNWEYYRHRAHRFLSCWRFEDAAADFVIASRLNPNDWNVFYHLGLSYFLLRDYAKAAKAYARCYELTDADPELIAVTDWYYMTLKRLGNDEEAAKILARITDHMNPGENTAYYARLLMYKGLKKPEELLSTDPEEVTALELITMGFGIANYFLQNGQPDKAYDLMERVVKAGDENDCYFAFAYLASKVDLAHKGDEGDCRFCLFSLPLVASAEAKALQQRTTRGFKTPSGILCIKKTHQFPILLRTQRLPLCPERQEIAWNSFNLMIFLCIISSRRCKSAPTGRRSPMSRRRLISQRMATTPTSTASTRKAAKMPV